MMKKISDMRSVCELHEEKERLTIIYDLGKKKIISWIWL